MIENSFKTVVHVTSVFWWLVAQECSVLQSIIWRRYFQGDSTEGHWRALPVTPLPVSPLPVTPLLWPPLPVIPTPWNDGCHSPQMAQLEKKLELELQDDTRVIACRFPFPHWTPAQVTGEGIDTVWAYDARSFRGGDGRPWRSVHFLSVVPVQALPRVFWGVGVFDLLETLRLCLQQRLYFSPLWNEKWQLLSLTFGENKQKLRPAGRWKAPFHGVC